ncbi:MAG: DinB family protein [Candidatus Acidiferrum sp.]
MGRDEGSEGCCKLGAAEAPKMMVAAGRQELMNQMERIADTYHAATVKGAWYGPALDELLARVTPELAIARPTPGGHSISMLLQHLLLWNERTRNTSESQPMPRWEPEKEWAEPLIPWNELAAWWKQSRELLEEKIRNFSAEDFAQQVPGRDYSHETLLEGTVQHTIYHSGQIAMVLSMVGSRAQ